MSIFGSKSGNLNIVKSARFSSVSPNCCCICWFFRVLQYIWHYPLWKIIKYCKKNYFFWRKWRKIFKLFYSLNDRFWNQKCSPCSELHWDFDSKNWIVDFFTRFITHEKIPQNNFSCPNFSVYKITISRVLAKFHRHLKVLCDYYLLTFKT